VLVIEHGRITQMGTHEQLMREDGHYRDIAAVQLYGEEEPPRQRQDSPSHMDRLRDPRGIEAAVGASTAPRDDREEDKI